MPAPKEEAFSRMSALDLHPAAPTRWAIACGCGGGLLLAAAASELGFKATALLFGGVLVAVLVFYSPVLGLLLTAAVVPLERIGRLTDDTSMHTISLMRIMGLLALGSFLLHALLQKQKLRFGPAVVLYAMYAGFAVLTITYSEHRLGTVRAVGAILGNLLFFFLVINVVRTWRLTRTAIVVWLAASSLIGCYTLYDWYWGESIEVEKIGVTETRFRTVMQDPSEWEKLDVVRRAVGPTSSSAVYGINLIMTVPFFLYFLRRKSSPWVRGVCLVALLIVSYNIMLTNTRAAILLLIVVLMICVARRLLEITPPRVLAAAVLVLALLPQIPAELYQRIFDLQRYQFSESGTFQVRVKYWKAGLEIAEQNWLLGIGVGNQAAIPRFLKGDGPEETTVHNEFLMTLIEVGIGGWVIFFGFVGFLLWSSFRAGRVFQELDSSGDRYWFMVACQTAMISVLLFGLQVDVFHFPLKGWWLVAGLSWVQYEQASVAAMQVRRPALGGVCYT
jgi:O-antigen ligase